MLDPVVKDWFLDYHECMNVKHTWNMMQSWRRAQEMFLSLLKDVCRWTHSECKKKNKDRKLNIAHLTLLGQAGNILAGQVALTSRTYERSSLLN